MKNTPQQAEAEKRTIANALGQSWCMLNNRACNEFMDKVYKSKYRLDIRPIGQIHDAMYFIVRNDPEVIKFCNDNITLAMSWQDDPRIDNPDVKLIGDLDIFYPSWKEKITLRNPITSGKEVTIEEIKSELTKLINKEN